MNISNIIGGSVTVNGKSYKGSNVTINGDKVIIDGVEQDSVESKIINVSIDGNVGSINSDSGRVDCLDVGSVETQTGNVTCRDITGDVETQTGNVKASTIHGSVETMTGNISGRNK